MSTLYGSRRKFIEVIEEVFRNLHFDPPAMTHDADAALVMELDVEGINFEVVHNPRSNPEFCLIEARVGPMVGAKANQALLNLLQKNFEFSKNYSGCFAADIKDDEILYNSSLPLAQLSGDALLQKMRETGTEVRNWRVMLSDINSAEFSIPQSISAGLV